MVKKAKPQVLSHWQLVRRWIVGVGTTAAALTAIGTLWLSLGFPRLAFSTDIQKLSAIQADIAIDVYSKQVRDAQIARATTKNDPTTQALIDQQLSEAQVKLKQSIDRKLELAK